MPKHFQDPCTINPLIITTENKEPFLEKIKQFDTDYFFWGNLMPNLPKPISDSSYRMGIKNWDRLVQEITNELVFNYKMAISKIQFVACFLPHLTSPNFSTTVKMILDDFLFAFAMKHFSKKDHQLLSKHLNTPYSYSELCEMANTRNWFTTQGLFICPNILQHEFIIGSWKHPDYIVTFKPKIADPIVKYHARKINQRPHLYTNNVYTLHGETYHVAF